MLGSNAPMLINTADVAAEEVDSRNESDVPMERLNLMGEERK